MKSVSQLLGQLRLYLLLALLVGFIIGCQSQSIEDDASPATITPSISASSVNLGTEVISAHNAAQLEVLKRFNNGTLDNLVGFSDGQILVAGSLGLWKIDLTSETSELMPDVQFPSFHRQSNKLAFFRDDRVHVVDFLTDEIYAQFDYSIDKRPSLVFNSSGDLLATYSFDGPIKIWNLQNDTELISVELDGVLDLAFDQNDNAFVIRRKGDFFSHEFELWNITRDELLYSFSSDGLVYSAQLQPSVNRLVTIEVYKAEVRQLDTGELIETVDNAVAAYLTESDDQLITIMEDWDRRSLGLSTNLIYHQVGVYDLAGREIAHVFDEHLKNVTDIMIDQHENTLYALSSEENTIYSWSIDQNTFLGFHRLEGFSQPILSLDYHSSSGWLAYCTGQTPEIHLVNISTLESKIITDLNILPALVKIHSDGQFLISADHRLRFWDIESGAHENVFSGFFGISSISFSPAGDYILVAGSWAVNQVPYYVVRVLDYEQRDLVIPDIETGPVRTVLHHPTRKQVAFASGTYVYEWDLERNLRLSMRDAGSEITGLAYSPDGSFLLAGTENGQVLLWEGAEPSSQLLLELNPRSSIYNIAFQKDRTLLAYSAGDTIHLFDFMAQTDVVQLTEHTRLVRHLQFSDDGTLLISASDDGTIITWAIQ